MTTYNVTKPLRPTARRPELPIVEPFHVSLTPKERETAASLAARLLAEEPALPTTEAFGPKVSPGLGRGPRVLLSDYSSISLFDPGESHSLQYRALLLAGEGDRLVLGTRRSPTFESYCRDLLGLGQVDVDQPAMTVPNIGLAESCMYDRGLLDRLAALAEASGELTILPYMGSGKVWQLAGAIAERARVPIHVVAASPRLTRRVNDKLWFAQRVNELLGQSSLPPTYSAYGPAALVARVMALARQHSRIAIKVTDSAGSAGNLVLRSAPLLSRGPRQLQKLLLRLLHQLRWRDAYPLLVAIWEAPVIASPSAQLWIPESAEVEPTIEDVYEQIITEPVGEFIGATQSVLPPAWQDRIRREALRLGYLFQQLGYVGQCSVDALITGEELDTAELHWLECNGRWGGVSIPMMAAVRLTGGVAVPPIVVVHHGGLDLPPRNFDSVLDVMGDRLFRPGETESGVVFLAPGRIEDGTGVDLMTIGRSASEARHLAEDANTILSVTG